jgi:hypothetical protein
MKDIEDRAKPIMTDLILGNDTRIFPADQEVIATWAILKVMVAEFDINSNVTIHHSQRKFIKAHKVAPMRGWSVWIGHYERKDWLPEWVSRPMLLVSHEIANRRVNYETTHFNSNSTTQVLGKLFIHVIHTPMTSLIKRWRFSFPHKGAFFRIWPPVQSSIKWPGAALDDRSADDISDALFRYMSKVQADWFASRETPPA